MVSKKIILDTNLWISFLISKSFQQIDKLIEAGKLTLIFSDELIEEFVDVVSRPKFKKYFTTEDIENVLMTFDKYGELHKTTSNIELCRDVKDNFLLNLAVDCKADYLITGDKDLLVLEKIEKTKIITFSNFIEEMI